MSLHDTPAALRLMSTLLASGEAGASREQLVQQADVGTTTFYRVVRPLEADGLVVEHDGRYVLPLAVPYNYRFKQWRDMERLYRLPEVDRAAILDILDQARRSLGDDMLCLWLVGSAAHDALTPGSDLDFIALCKKDRTFFPITTRELNFFCMTAAHLDRSLDSQDPFVVGALRYGLILHDREFAQRFYARLPVAHSVPITGQHEQVIHNLESRFHFFVEQQEMAEASKALKSIAVQTARFMLGPFGELPGPKHELLASARLYLGDGFADALASAMLDDPELPTLMRRKGIISQYRTDFQAHATHLVAASRILFSPVALETELPSLLGELFPEFEIEIQPHAPGRGRRRTRTIFLQADRKPRHVVSCKASKGALRAEDLATAVGHTASTKNVLVCCPFRDLPPLQRPPLTPALIAEAARCHIHLLPATDIVRAHGTLHLDGRPTHELQTEVLGL